jgi:hypothetical protein
MSESGVRKQERDIINAAIRVVENHQRENVQLLIGLNHAIDVLSQPPRTIIECKFTELPRQTIAALEVWCSECSESSFGDGQAWNYCPRCGSTCVERVQGNISSKHEFQIRQDAARIASAIAR